MPFPKTSPQVQEEIFPRELKGFPYEEVTSLNFIGKLEKLNLLCKN